MSDSKEETILRQSYDNSSANTDRISNHDNSEAINEPEPHPVSLEWLEILNAFRQVFIRTFARSKKAHFDSLPVAWAPDDKVVDGARGKWCLPLLLDATIYLIEQQSFDLSRRRSFNQHRVLFECIWLVIQRKLESSSSTLTRLLQARQAGDLEAVQSMVSLSFSEEEEDELWLKGTIALRDNMLNEPCSKSARKFECIIHALCSHRALNQAPFASNQGVKGNNVSSKSLVKALEIAVCRAIAHFPNYIPSSTSEKSGWKGRGRANGQYLAQLALLGSLLAMAPNSDPATVAMLAYNQHHYHLAPVERKVRPVRRAKERAAASMNRYREIDSDSEDDEDQHEENNEEDDEGAYEEEIEDSEADGDDVSEEADECDDQVENSNVDGEKDRLKSRPSNTSRVSPTDVTQHPALLSPKPSSQGGSGRSKSPYHLRSPSRKGKKKKKVFVNKARGHRSPANVPSSKKRLATDDDDQVNLPSAKRWRQSSLAKGEHRIYEEEDEESELIEFNPSFDEHCTQDHDYNDQESFANDPLLEWQSLADEEEQEKVETLTGATSNASFVPVHPAHTWLHHHHPNNVGSGIDFMLWQSLDRPDAVLHPHSITHPEVLARHQANYHHLHRAPHQHMVYMPSMDYYEHRRVSPLLHPGYYAPVSLFAQQMYGRLPYGYGYPHHYLGGATLTPATSMSALTEVNATVMGVTTSASGEETPGATTSRGTTPESGITAPSNGEEMHTVDL